MRADPVVELPVRLDLLGQTDDRRDLLAVQVLVLQTLVEALDDAVGLGRVMAGPDMTELGVTGDEVDEVGALEGGTVEFPIDVKPPR